MKTIICTCLVFLTGVLAQAQIDEDWIPTIDTLVEESMNRGIIPGVAVGIIAPNGSTTMLTYGIADQTGRNLDADTVFPIGSFTKSMTALSILELEGRGALSLEETLETYLPGAGDITIAQLLHQTGGITTSSGVRFRLRDQKMEIADWCRKMLPLPVNQAPGTGFEYSNTNYNLLGLVIEEASGQSYADFAEETVFRKLGMMNSTMVPNPISGNDPITGFRLWFGAIPRYIRYSSHFKSHSPSMGAYSSLSDLCRYLPLYMNAGQLEGKSIVPASMVHRLMHPEVPAEFCDVTGFYGMSWQNGRIEDREVVFTQGGTDSSRGFMYIFPELDVGLVVLMNRNSVFWSEELDHLPLALASAVSGISAPEPTQGPPRLMMVSLLSAIAALQILGLIRISTGKVSPRWIRIAANFMMLFGIVIVLPVAFGIPLSGMAYIHPELVTILYVIAALTVAVIIAEMILRYWKHCDADSSHSIRPDRV